MNERRMKNLHNIFYIYIAGKKISKEKPFSIGICYFYQILNFPGKFSKSTINLVNNKNMILKLKSQFQLQNVRWTYRKKKKKQQIPKNHNLK